MKSEELSIVKRLFYYMTLLAAVLLTACSSDETAEIEQPLPEGMGCIRLTICSPENAGASRTRAVNVITPWEEPDHEWERLQTFRVYICSLTDGNYVVKQIIPGDKLQFGEPSTDLSEHTYRTASITSQPLEEGSYYIFATANFNSSDNIDDAYDDNIAEGSTINENALMKFANSSNYYIVGDDTPYSGMKNIPMTGKLTDGNGLKKVEVYKGSTANAGTLMLWRVIGKMQFEFTNESEQDIQILGIEVDPINKVSTDNPGIFLFSKDDLTSTANLVSGANPPTGKEGLTLPDGVREDMGPVVFTPALGQPLTLTAKNGSDPGQGKLYFYVNESDGTFTTTNNQYSLRFKIKRGGTIEEIRYGVTTQWDETNGGGFNVIRRNDWIHIPVVLTDWQLRIEPLAFVPIAGYPATLLSSDALTATFSTGGLVALQPFVKKYNDATWRDFSNPEVTFVSMSWKNSDGTNVSGDGKIVKTAFAYDSVTKSIIGELNQAKVGSNSMTTFVVNVKLGPTGSQYDYSFTFNVILQ